jgi:DivIVA domain-containing protein
VTWFFALLVVVLIGAVAVVASGRWGAMGEAYDDRPDVLVPARHALTAADIESSRFGVGVRGYRMDEVDTLLERVAREVAERDRRIADLERAVMPIVHGPEGAGFTPRAHYVPNGQVPASGVETGASAGGHAGAARRAEEQFVAQADQMAPGPDELPVPGASEESAAPPERAGRTELTDPAEPPAPDAAAEGFEPVRAAEPAPPAGTVEPFHPGDPVSPAGTVEPVHPGDSVDPLRPTDSVEPIDPRGPVEVSEAADTVRSGDSVEPAPPAGTVEPVDPDELVPGSEAVEAVGPAAADPTRPGEPALPAEDDPAVLGEATDNPSDHEVVANDSPTPGRHSAPGDATAAQRPPR